MMNEKNEKEEKIEMLDESESKNNSRSEIVELKKETPSKKIMLSTTPISQVLQTHICHCNDCNSRWYQSIFDRAQAEVKVGFEQWVDEWKREQKIVLRKEVIRELIEN